MKRFLQTALALFILAFTIAGCQKNYYSGKAKNNDCGCPNKKGMVGY
jgi:hypothetical protein